MKIIFAEPPTSPASLKVLYITKDTVTLEWKKPRSDGGGALTGYRVERQDPKTGAWSRVDEVDAYETMYTVHGLVEGVDYNFRVSAMNPAGKGEPVQTEQSIVPHKPLGRQGSPPQQIDLGIKAELVKI